MPRNMSGARIMDFCWKPCKLEVRSDLPDTEIRFGHLVFDCRLHNSIFKGFYMAGEGNYYGNLACVICQAQG